MLRSQYCALLRLRNDREMAEMNECPLDPGGYFLINGSEKVTLTVQILLTMLMELDNRC
jgi:DNA-directed RNA polymerase beta subunit